LQRAIARNEAQIPIIEDQAAEAIRRLRLNNDALRDAIGQAEAFLEEEKRQENKALAYELVRLGIDRIEDVANAPDQERLREDLERDLEVARRRAERADEDIDDFLDSMTG